MWLLSSALRTAEHCSSWQLWQEGTRCLVFSSFNLLISISGSMACRLASVHFEVNCVTTRPRCTSYNVVAHHQRFIFKRHDCIMVIVPCLLVRTFPICGINMYNVLWNIVQMPRTWKAIAVSTLSDVCPHGVPDCNNGVTIGWGCDSFRCVSWNSEQLLLDSSCLCVSLSSCVSSAPSGRIFVKFHSGDLKETPWRYSRFR